MFKISKCFMSLIMVCVMMFCVTAVSASAAEKSEEMEALAEVYVTENGVEVVSLDSEMSSYSYLADDILNPGAGRRSITITIPSGKTARQLQFVGGLNGGAPAGATGVISSSRINTENNQYLFSYGDPILIPLLPTTNSITFTVTPNAPYNGSEYTYHYAFILYGN